ncbi:esterase OVCA2-like isoform X2 [Dreissena polymorpha]|uniref:esterase OVCA2-like isoform X2 n=1 Tax=Dreissena polymorpha TaxID=45954 RepID=UPI0022642814|nr:esterase OVCA2-like isoform X2 [Dreissena polymorpha]
MAAAVLPKDKLKILCLHGYRQNALSFRERTGAFRKIPVIKKNTELVFITAPNRVPPLPTVSDEETKAEGEGEDMGWWFSRLDNSYVAKDYTDCCPGYQDSIDLVTGVFKEQGPFDGVLSFSQGAAFASLLCGIQQQNPDSPIKFNFVIFVAGFKSRQSAHNVLYSKKITIPSLHVFGKTDKVIMKEMSEDLLQYFEAPTVLEHEGGHFVPASGPQKPVYTDFLQKMLAKKASS